MPQLLELFLGCADLILKILVVRGDRVEGAVIKLDENFLFVMGLIFGGGSRGTHA